MQVLPLNLSLRSVLVRWLIATAFGWAAGLTLAAGITTWLAQQGWVNEDRFMAYAMLVGAALLTSLAQALMLGGVLPSAGRWVAASVAGGLLAALWIRLLALLGFPGEHILSNAVLLVGIGLALGAGQAWLLRRSYRRAALWLPATALGYLVFMALVANPSESLEEFILRATMGGVLAGVLPGLLLAWWKRQSGSVPAAIPPDTPLAGD